jgi:hypothetical protein
MYFFCLPNEVFPISKLKKEITLRSKILTLSLLILVSTPLSAETVIRPTFPGGSIPDLSRPAMVQEGNVIYESYPASTIRDYSKPSYVIENNGDGSSTLYEAFPASNVPNKLEGGYRIQER